MNRPWRVQLPEAEAAVAAAFEIWGSLIKGFPEEIEYRYGLARTYANQGMQLMWWGGQVAKAEEALRQADALLSKLQEERPGEPRFRADLDFALGNLGVILGWTKRYDEKERVERRALKINEALAAEFPDVPDYQDRLARSMSNLADTLDTQGRGREREELLRRALAIRERLAERHPEIPEYEADLVDLLRILANSLYRQGNVEGARQVQERGVLRARAFLKAHPRLRDAQITYSNALAPLGWFLYNLGDHAPAATILEEWCSAMLERLRRGGARAAPPGALPRADRQRRQGAASVAEPKRQRLQRYQREEIRSLIQEALRRGLDGHEVMFTLAELLTTAPKELRDPELGLKLARRAVELKPDHAFCHQTLGWARYRAGDWKGCIDSLKKAEDDGDFFRAMARWQLGEKAEARLEFDRADAWFKGYDERCKEREKRGVYTLPRREALRQIRAEAAALLGLEPSVSETRPKSASEPTSPPK